MSNRLYSSMQATGIRLTKKYGALVDYYQYSSGGGDYNPASGDASVVSGSFISSKRLALITDQAGNRVNPKDGQILDAGTLVQGGDKWIYFLSDGPPPVLQDQTLIKGVRYSIKDVQTFGPGGIDVLYLCVVKQ